MKRAVVIACALLVVGCRPAEHPRATLRASVLTVARAVKEVDVLCADSARATKRADVAEACADAYRTARESLLAAEAALDTWDASAQRDVVCAGAKGSRALLAMVRAAKGAGASLPPAVVDGAALAETLVGLAERTCP